MAITKDMYSRILGGVSTLGRARKKDSDMIMDVTWDGDIQSQVAYCYDYYHDNGAEKFKMRDLHPQNESNKIPIAVKFIRHESQSLNKDPVTFWLQFKPGQECVLDYYASVLGDKYGATWPVGIYFDILAEDGKYNKWLCVNTANYWGNQFPTYQILPVDYLLQWIHKGQKCQCPVVLASQNSYNFQQLPRHLRVQENWVISVKVLLRKYRDMVMDCARPLPIVTHSG